MLQLIKHLHFNPTYTFTLTNTCPYQLLGVLRGFAKVWGKGKSLGGAGDFEGICKGIAHPLKPLGSLVSLNY